MSPSSKSKNKKRNQPKSAFSEAKKPSSFAADAPKVTDPKRQWYLTAVFLGIVIGGGILAMNFKGSRVYDWANSKIEKITYEVVKEYKHDPLAFTQGLFFHGDRLYESTGLIGESTMRYSSWDGEKFEEEKRVVLPKDVFGEGCVMLNDKVYQLTWKDGVCIVWNKDLTEILDRFEYDGQGWGLTTDGEYLIMADGSEKLVYRDPDDFSIIDTVRVVIGNRPITKLNELEFYNDRVYANRLGYDLIYEIDPAKASVTGKIDLTGLWPTKERGTKEGVLNGIAIDPERPGRLFVTGKYCPKIFEIELLSSKRK